MILEISDFIQARIKEIEPNFRFDQSSSDIESVGSLRANQTYKIVIGSFSTIRLNKLLESTVQVDVVIYHIGKNDYFNDYAKAYCMAIDIQAAIAKQENLDQTKFVKEFLPVGITPLQINGDDNLMKFTISFNVRLAYISK